MSYDLLKKISSILIDAEKYLFGYADMRGLQGNPYTGFNYALSIAQKLDTAIIDEITDGPTKKYLEDYHRLNTELFNLELTISRIMNEENVENLPIKPTFEDDELDDSYFTTLRTPFSHKMAATRAGIGWIGKTDLLITKKFGPRVRLATILFRHEKVRTGTPINKSGCGKCTKISPQRQSHSCRTSYHEP